MCFKPIQSKDYYAWDSLFLYLYLPEILSEVAVNFCYAHRNCPTKFILSFSPESFQVQTSIGASSDLKPRHHDKIVAHLYLRVQKVAVGFKVSELRDKIQFSLISESKPIWTWFLLAFCFWGKTNCNQRSIYIFVGNCTSDVIKA